MEGGTSLRRATLSWWESLGDPSICCGNTEGSTLGKAGGEDHSLRACLEKEKPREEPDLGSPLTSGRCVLTEGKLRQKTNFFKIIMVDFKKEK